MYIFSDKYDSTCHIYPFLYILNFKSIITYFIHLLTYRNLNLYPGKKLFVFIETSHNTRRNNINLLCPQFRSTSFNNSVLYNGPKLLNSLSAAIQNLRDNNISQFKKTNRMHLFTPKTHEKGQCHVNKIEFKLFSYL